MKKYYGPDAEAHPEEVEHEQWALEVQTEGLDPDLEAEALEADETNA